MSEIQRYDKWTDSTCTEYMQPWPTGEYVKYTDLLWYQRNYRGAVLTLIVVCALFAAYLVWNAHAPQPVAISIKQNPNAKLEQQLATVQHLELLLAEKKQNDFQHAQDLERIKRLEQYASNLSAQIRALNKKTTPVEQTENLKLAASTMHDADIQALAREVGFSKIRVVE